MLIATWGVFQNFTVSVLFLTFLFDMLILHSSFRVESNTKNKNNIRHNGVLISEVHHFIGKKESSLNCRHNLMQGRLLGAKWFKLRASWVPKKVWG